MSRVPTSLCLMLLTSAAMVAGCGAKAPPCVVCYEDEWSREPFPGQAKQHLPVLTPDDLKHGAPVSTREFLGESKEGY